MHVSQPAVVEIEEKLDALISALSAEMRAFVARGMDGDVERFSALVPRMSAFLIARTALSRLGEGST